MDKGLYPKVKCPKCASTDIDDYDIYEEEGAFINGVDALVEYHVGACLKCGAELQWKRCYTFCGITEIETSS